MTGFFSYSDNGEQHSGLWRMRKLSTTNAFIKDLTREDNVAGGFKFLSTSHRIALL